MILSRAALGAVGMSFFLMGSLAAAYGPLLGDLSRRFEISLSVAGAALSVQFAGAVAGVVAGMWALERLPARLWVRISLVCLGAGCGGFALAPSWTVLLAAALVIGLGFGGLVIGLNQLVAHGGGPRRSSLLNALNGTYSMGAVAGPVLIWTFGGERVGLLYSAAAVLALALVPAVAGISGRLPLARSESPAERTGQAGVLVPLFVVAFALYTGMEAGVGGWMTSHLESVGRGAAVAAALTSGFWLALALGRLLVALTPPALPGPVIVLGGAGASAAALLAALSGAVAPAAYVVTGLAFAPIFPTGIVWLARLRHGDSRATSWLFPASMLGGAVVPGAVGIVIGRFGIGWAPAVLSAVALGCLAAFALAMRVASRPD